MDTLALEFKESPEDLLALAVKVIADKNARTIDNLTHLASACKSFTRTNPLTPERVLAVVTPDYIEHVLIQEICDNIAQRHIQHVLGMALSNEWDRQHPNQGAIPQDVCETIHALRCVDGRGWQEADRLADNLEYEWARRLNWYQGQYDHIMTVQGLTWDTRMREDVRDRPRRFREARE